MVTRRTPSADVTLDGNGYPVLPDDALTAPNMGTIHVSITESNAVNLPNGTYIVPYNPNGSSGGTVSFLDPGFVFGGKGMQVQLNVKLSKDGGTYSCEEITDILVRYGEPPSGANQSLGRTCTIEYTYDASNNSFAGSLTSDMESAWGTDEKPTETAKLKARFTHILTE